MWWAFQFVNSYIILITLQAMLRKLRPCDNQHFTHTKFQTEKGDVA